MMIFNFLFVLCGLGLFGMGLYFYLGTFFKDMGSDGRFFVFGFYVLMGVGAFTLIVGACGCCGAYHESPCLLGTYFILLWLIFAAEIAAGVLIVLYREKVKDLIGNRLETGKEVLKTKPADKPHWMDEAQRFMSCCGYNGPSDYEIKPKSCCPGNICDESNYYKNGCNATWKEYVQTKWMIVAGVILGIALIELFGLIFSMCLCCTSRSIDYDMVETRA